MTIHTLRRTQRFPFSPGTVFTFFQSPENLAIITPASLGFRILTPSPVRMKDGALIDYTVKWFGIPVRWRTLITTYEPPHKFVDEQIRGPYSMWHHSHTFREVDNGTEMIDEVRYILPLGLLGDLVHGMIVKRQLDHIFDFRAKVIGTMFPAKNDREGVLV